MFRRLCRGLAWGALAYVAGGAGGCAAITWLSSNLHDRPLEAAMTGAFVIGPVAGLAAFVAGVARRNRVACPGGSAPPDGR